MPGGGLFQVSSRRHGLLRGAWRGQTVPAFGLHHGCSQWRNAALQGAWRGQALSEGALLPTRLSSGECVLRAMSKGHTDRRHAACRTRIARQDCAASHERIRRAAARVLGGLGGSWTNSARQHLARVIRTVQRYNLYMCLRPSLVSVQGIRASITLSPRIPATAPLQRPDPLHLHGGFCDASSTS